MYVNSFHQKSIESASSKLKEVSVAIKAKIDEMREREEAKEREEAEFMRKLKDRDEL